MGTGNGAAVQGNNLTGTGQGVPGVGPTAVLGLPLPGGTGVLGTTALDGTGIALHAEGPAQFDAQASFVRSGKVQIAFPHKSATITEGGLTSSALVLATVQDTTGVYVVSAVPNVSAGTALVVLNKAPGSSTHPRTATVAWFVVN